MSVFADEWCNNIVLIDVKLSYGTASDRTEKSWKVIRAKAKQKQSSWRKVGVN